VDTSAATKTDLKYGLELTLFTLLYYLSAKVGLFLEVEYGGLTPIWPPSGITVAIFLIRGIRYWPMAIVGEFLIALTLQQQPLSGLVGGLAQTLEAGLAVYFLRTRRIAKITSSAGSMLWFTLLGVLIPPILSSAIGTTSLRLLGFLPPGEYASGFLTWWLGDAISILVLTPLIVDLRIWPVCRISAYVYFFIFSAISAAFCLSVLIIGNARADYLFFTLIPLVVVSAIHFRLIGAGSMILLLTLIVFGMHPQKFGGGDFITIIRITFVGTCAFTGYLVTGFMEKRQRHLDVINRHNQYFKSLHELILGLITHLDIKQLEDTILSQACELLNTESAYLFQLRSDTGTIELKIGKGLYSNLPGYLIKPGEGVAGRVWQQGQALMINNYQQWEGRHPDKVWDEISAVIGVPIKVDGKVVGVLGILYTEHNRHFTAEDLSIIQKFGELASVAWKNAFIHSRLSDELAARKKAESHLGELQTAMEFVVEDIMITDTSGKILYVNPGFTAATGYSKADALGKTPQILQSGVHDTAFYTNLWNTVLGGKVWTGRFHNRHKAGHIILQEASLAPIRDQERTVVGFVSVKRDVTEHEKIKQQLAKAQKMEAIGTLASGIAHDFNNILAGIIGHSDLALNFHLSENHPAAKSIREVLVAGKRAAELVKQILTFSHSSEVELKPIDVKPIVKEVLNFVSSSLPSTIHIEKKITAARSSVLACPSYIHQILMNLVTNAMQAMPTEKGCLQVSLSNTRIQKTPEGLAGMLKPGEYIEISVADTGCGMQEDTIEKIFEPYFTTKATGEGTGLGLSVVHGIVNKLGGEIKVSSNIGEGTTFRIFLPVHSSREEQASRDEPPLPGGDESILFVDDNPLLTDIASQLLGRLGYQVTVFADSAVALDHFSKDPDQFHMVISDMLMPHMTGAELSRAIKASRPQIPIIICTGNPHKISKRERDEIGIVKVARKPLNLNELAILVRKALDG